MQIFSNNDQQNLYDSNKRPNHAFEEFINIFKYRFLVLQLIRRNITTRYKRSALGVAWTMINPLGTMIILSIVFSRVFKVEGYAAYILCGIMSWSFFAQTTVACIVDLTWGSQLLHRIYIPRTAFALAAIGTGLVNILISTVPLIIVVAISGLPIQWTVIYLPIPILLLACFSLGFGLLISTFAVYFPDVAEMYQIILTAWMYLTPIIYPENALPDTVRVLIQWLNPMYHLVRLFRAPIYSGVIPSWSETWPALLVCAGVLALGWWYFTKKSDEFSYRL